MTPGMTQTPWTRANVLKVVLLAAVGAVLWAVGWYRVAERPALDDQISPLNLAILGWLVIAVGYASWFTAGRRAVGARRRALLTFAADLQERVSVRAVPTTDADVFVGAERYFHRPQCAMVTDRSWAPHPPAEHERAGRVPCGLCVP